MHEISIIIPCHNVENYIDRCFESLKAQTIGLDKLQLIFVDDASTDGTRDKLSQIEAQAPSSVCVILLPQNMRQGGARNVGLEYATGTYIGFVDSDDWVEPDMYECLLNAITETGSDFAFCRHVRDTGKENLYLSASEKDATSPARILTIQTLRERSDFIAANPVGCNVWDKLFRKDFLLDNEIFFPPHLAYEDIFFSSLVYLYANKACMLEQKLYHYFVNENSTVLSKNNDYHKNIITINELKWESYQQRGIPEALRSAIEFDFIVTFYFTGIKILCLRFDSFQYDDFMQLKKGILERIPDFRSNPYLKTNTPDFYKPLLTLLEHPITQEDLTQIQNAFLTYHKMN